MASWHNMVEKINRVIYQKDVELISSPAKKDMDKLIVQSMLANMFGIFTGGVFLLGYLIYLGAADEVISYVPIIPSVCGVLVIFCGGMVERFEHRRRLIVCLNIMTRVSLTAIIVIPLIMPRNIAIPIVYFLLVAGYALNNINGLAVNTMIVQLVPMKIRGRYFSTRQILTVLTSLILPVMAGRAVDMFQNEYHGFLLMYVLAVVAAIAETFMFSRMSDPLIKSAKKPPSLIEVITIPLKNKPFVNYTVRVGLFQFFLNMSMSFSSIYAIKYIGVSYTYMNAVSILNFALQIFVTYKFWGIVTDRIGASFTLFHCMWFYMLDTAAWFCISPATIYFILPLGHFFGSINSTGYMVGSFNRRYELIPEEGRVIYDSFFTAFIGFSLLLAPVAGNFIRKVASETQLFDDFSFGYIRIAYVASIFGLLLLQLSDYMHMKKHDRDNPCLRRDAYTQAKEIFKEVMPRQFRRIKKGV